MIRSFTFSRSKWSSSRIWRACSRSRLSSVTSFQGSVRIQSRYVRMTPYSAAAGGRLLEPVQLAQHRLLDVLGQVLLADLLTQLVDLGLLVVGLAELLLDRLQLLPEEELPLALVDLAGDLRLDLRAELRHLDLAAEDQRDPAQPLLDVGRLEQLLALLGLQPQRRGDQVGERGRVVDVRRCELQLLGQVRRHADDPRELLLDGPRERLHLGRVRDDLRQVLEVRDEIGLVLDRRRRAGRAARPGPGSAASRRAP